jgi:mannose-1-phosphate guanylyltransferase
LAYAVEPEPLDTAGGIAFAARAAGIAEPFLAVNGDVLTDIDVSELVALHQARGAEATIALTPVDDPSKFGVVSTDDDGRVRAFIEKPEPGTAPTNYINAGIYVLEPSVLDRVPAGARVSIEREVFPALVEAGRLYALASDAYWIDTGNSPEAYLQSNLDAAAIGSGGGAVISASARVDPDAQVTDAEVFDDAVIGRDAVVSRSIVGRRAVVGEGAIVDDFSVLGDGAIVPPGAVVHGERVSVVA